MVAVSDKKKEKGYTITVPTALYDQVKRLADREGRSFNKQVTQALQEMVEARKAATRKDGAS